MSGGKKQATTNTTQQSNPWAPLEPYLKDIFSRGQVALDQTPKTGDLTYAGPNQDQLTAADWIRGAAGQLGTGSDILRNEGLKTISGEYLNPETNPWLAKTGSIIADTANRNLTQGVLPALADQAILGGAYGGSGYGVSQGLAAGESQRGVADALTGMYGQNYQLERDRQLQGGNLLNQANELALAPGTVLGGLGDMIQGWDQSRLDANIAAPWNGLDRFAAILGLGTPYGSSTSNTVQTPAGRSGFGSFLGGAAGGASAGSAFGPWGAGIGGLLGGLGGLFG